MSFLRRVAGRSLRDRVRSSVTREELGVEPLLLHIERGQLRWLGHLFRLSLGRLPGEVFRACPTGKKPRGRPRTRWRDYVSWLVWERLRVPLEELEEVSGEREAMSALDEKCEVERALNDLQKIQGDQQHTIHAQEISKLEDTVAAMQINFEKTLNASSASQKELQDSLVSAKHELLRVQDQLTLAEKELEKKFQQTAAYRNMKEILNKKNDQIKELRKRLQSSNHIVKFAEDMTVVGLISKNNESMRAQSDHSPLFIDGSPVEIVKSTKYLGVHLAENFTWSLNTTSISKKAHLPPPILTMFYRGTIESVLSSCITAWIGNCTVSDCKTLQRIVRTTEKIIGVSLPSIMDIEPYGSIAFKTAQRSDYRVVVPRQFLKDVDTQELKAGDTLYFRPIDVDRGVSPAVRFLEVHNELFVLCGIEGEVVLGTPC
ncbi:hypothetical protein QTP70_003259 [Hemibagrus guttatus]|uniref:Leucine zipper transcription factor-like protein 1 n=1 Tax=Hemibagrus guttatus TaxID=175788 RepID=A0AAE0URX8_9TELE|nr:hypothetical protein QTP70_003259 [Hemibagrus guttatus]